MAVGDAPERCAWHTIRARAGEPYPNLPQAPTITCGDAVNFKDRESAQKLRGGYYTPLDLAVFVSRWVSGCRPRQILEPSCGDGVFFEALASCAAGLPAVRAFEIDEVEAGKAVLRADALENLTVDTSATDFLHWAVAELRRGSQLFDGVVGNPPFIRYQYLPKAFQALAEEIFRRLGCSFTRHTNAWVPFVLASMALLRPGGRLGMVVPAELMHVKHAQSLRAFLVAACSRLVVVDPVRLWFSDTLQGAVILLAEKKRARECPFEGLGVVRVEDREFADQDSECLFRSTSTVNGRTVEGKWTRALLDSKERSLLEDVETDSNVKRFGDVADVDVGIVTGANKFFFVSNETVAHYELQDYAVPMFGRSEHCPGIVYNQQQHRANESRGKPTNLIWFRDGGAIRHQGAARYIEYGEAQGLHRRYKCRVRSPWYCVPSVYATGVGMLKRSHHSPRLVLNEAKALSTDTAYRIRTVTVEARTLVTCFLNPLTALSAELEGRHYGGGVLELVPSEIERLLVPVPRGVDVDLRALDEAVRTRPTDEVLRENGSRVLAGLGLGRDSVDELLGGWSRLRDRRQRVGTKSGALSGAAGPTRRRVAAGPAVAGR